MTAKPLDTVQSPSSLRERAQALIHGTSTGPRAAKDASLALRVLFDLASSPETAPDALALLHELQVHQVELDLQNEELQSSRGDLEAAWARQNQLHQASPCAQLVLDAAGHLLECNANALTYFDQSLAQMRGQRLENWLSVADVPGMQAWIAKAHHHDNPTSLGLTLHTQHLTERHVCAAARANPLAPGVLLAWVEAASPVECGNVG